MKYKIALLFLATLVIAYISYGYLRSIEINNIQKPADKALFSIKLAYDSILDTYIITGKQSFYRITKDNRVIEILKEFRYADSEKEKELLRGELYRHLYKYYDFLKQFGIRQFHFHTYDGGSLLRFHMPYLNGDSLLNIRNSIKILTTEHKSVIGFEGGRIYPAFRYMFPIIDHNVYLGSVEISVAFEGINHKLKSVLPFFVHKIIYERSSSIDKIFKDYRGYFKRSKISQDYYVENSTISKHSKLLQDNKLVNRLSALVKNYPGISKKLAAAKSFAVPIFDNHEGYVVTFLNIKDIDNKSSAYMVSFAKLNDIVSIKHEFNIFKIVLLLVISLLFILITVLMIQFQGIKEESGKLTRFIDTLDSIVILSDGEYCKFGNKKFLDFFGYRTLDGFLKEYKCICDLFVKNNNDHFTLDDVKEDEKNWIESLMNLTPSNRIAAIFGNNGKLHIFSIAISKFDDEDYIVSFNDITETMDEKVKLQEEIIIDPLTKAYNRIYLDKCIDDLMSIYQKENKKTGIIFFDIDFFKKINDTYGHHIGDDALKKVVSITKSNIRSSDKLIRWGGEEFVILVPVNSLQELYKIAENIREKIEKYRFEVFENITCSFGLHLHEYINSINESIDNADTKLYIAKQRGRNRVVT